MKAPPFLQSGDTVVLVSPGKVILRKEIINAIETLEDWGLKVELGKNALGSWNRFSGKDEERAEDMQWALDHPKAKAIFCNRGGYGSIRILPKLDFSNFMNSPKWLVGYSDITCFHNHLHQLGIQSLHGIMPLDFGKGSRVAPSVEGLKKRLFIERSQKIEWRSDIQNKTGTTAGVLIGGNLSVLTGLVGTSYDIDTTDKILFLEDLCEELYHTDRMLQQLKTSGKLERLSGLVVGQFTDMTDVSGWFDKNKRVEHLISDTCAEYGFPISFGLEAGHDQPNTPIILGKNYSLVVDQFFTELK